MQKSQELIGASTLPINSLEQPSHESHISKLRRKKAAFLGIGSNCRASPNLRGGKKGGSLWQQIWMSLKGNSLLVIAFIITMFLLPGMGKCSCGIFCLNCQNNLAGFRWNYISQIVDGAGFVGQFDHWPYFFLKKMDLCCYNSAFSSTKKFRAGPRILQANCSSPGQLGCPIWRRESKTRVEW